MVTQANQVKLDRYFNIVKIFLFVAPVLGYLYAASGATMAGITLPELLAQNPSITITFLMTMVAPYIAFLLGLLQKKLLAQDYPGAVLNLILLFIAQLFTQNLFYIMLLGYLLYKTTTVYNLNIRENLKTIKPKYLFMECGGSFIVIVLYLICFYASFQIR